MIAVCNSLAILLALLASMPRILLASLTNICDPLIEDSEYTVGRWVKKASQKSFVCCGWDNRNDPNIAKTGACKDALKVQTQYFKGTKFQAHDSYQGSNDFPTLFGGNACKCEDHDGELAVSKRESWEWVPNQCKLPSWNATAFCGVLGTRRVLLYGDSTMAQAGSTLMNMIKEGRGGCAHQIIFLVYNDYLELMSHGAAPSSRSAFVYPLEPYVKLFYPEIIVLNGAAHYHSMKDVMIAFDNIQGSIDAFKSLYRDRNLTEPMLIWRTAHPGHNPPLQDTPLSAYSYYMANPDVDRYKYNLFPAFDAISKYFAQNLGFKILDMFPLYYRIDSHPQRETNDFLHFCAPGPLDLFSILFFNLLNFLGAKGGSTGGTSHRHPSGSQAVRHPHQAHRLGRPPKVV